MNKFRICIISISLLISKILNIRYELLFKLKYHYIIKIDRDDKKIIMVSEHILLQYLKYLLLCIIIFYIQYLL